jgi:UPF0716 protein FxsA
MLLRLILLLTILPLVELYLLFQLARVTGPGAAVALVLVTGVLGAALARRQGLEVWRRIQREAAQGLVPAAGLMDAVLIFVAGVLLIAPGLLSDTLGLLLLVPPVRVWLRGRAIQWLKRRATVRFQRYGLRPAEAKDETIIDAEFTRRTEEPERLDHDPQHRSPTDL